MTHTQPGAERRISPRAPISEFVELQCGDSVDPARALALNVSNSGLAVAHCLLAEVGERVSCRLLFTPREPLELGARVVWVREADEEQPAAMGLCFDDITETRTAKLNTLVARARGGSLGTPLAGIPIDPFCEPGTWREDEGADTFDDRASSGHTPAEHYVHWVAPSPVTGSDRRPAVPWRLVVYVAAATVVATLGLLFLAYRIFF